MRANWIHWTTFVLIGTLHLPSANAAIPKNLDDSARHSVRATQEALSLPLHERVSRIRQQGPQGYRNLVEIMFDEKAAMSLRWKAVTAAGRIGRKEAQPEVERALRHEVWYMRSAGLLAARAVDRQLALAWARKLLSDKAMVVRAAAVDMIAEMGDRSATADLWIRLRSPENFKNGQSLFVREKIASALARLETSGHEDKFVALLLDRDESLHAPALNALERLTKSSVGPVGGTVADRRAAWLQWWKERKI